MHLLPLFSAGTNLLKVSGGGVHLSIFRLSPEAVAHRFPSLLYLIILRRCAGFWWVQSPKSQLPRPSRSQRLLEAQKGGRAQAQETGVVLQIPRAGACCYVYDLPLRGLEQSIRSSASPK